MEFIDYDWDVIETSLLKKNSGFEFAFLQI
jgi:hypothetical protein